MTKSSIQQLAEYGQSIWLDYISRTMLEQGDLKKKIELGLRGMTSNPSIFNQAIGSSYDYDDKIVELKGQGLSTFEIYDALTVRDIQDAADQFKAVYDETNGLDGYVSLEINPLLSDKVDEQVKEGLRLFAKVDRPNVMIKVPSTPEGFSVIEELISEGVNVNATLIFSLEQYVKTAGAYIRGLTRRIEAGKDVSRIHSVASVFISRIDSAIDAQLQKLIDKASQDEDRQRLTGLLGKAAVANSRVIFEHYQTIFSDPAVVSLKDQQANVQRVLWGSTSTKNPAYNDVKYVTELIARPTVNTLPEKTLNAYLDHGEMNDAFADDAQAAQDILDALKSQGIIIEDVCADLLRDGLISFNEAFESLLKSLETKAGQLSAKS